MPNQPCFCGSGKKNKKCHPTIRNGSLIANLYCIYKQLDEETKGIKEIICNPDCCDCCSGYFYISEIEFYAILEFIMRTEPKVYLDSVISNATTQLEQLRLQCPSEYRKLISPIDKFVNINHNCFDDSNIKKYGRCIFLNSNEGKCGIYSVRPIVCRLFGCYVYTSGCVSLERNQELSRVLLKDCQVNIIDNIDRYVCANGEHVLTRPYPIVYFFGKTIHNLDNPIFKTNLLYAATSNVESFLQLKLSRAHNRL